SFPDRANHARRNTPIAGDCLNYFLAAFRQSWKRFPIESKMLGIGPHPIDRITRLFGESLRKVSIRYVSMTEPCNRRSILGRHLLEDVFAILIINPCKFALSKPPLEPHRGL